MICPICAHKFVERQIRPHRDYCIICGYSHWLDQENSKDPRMAVSVGYTPKSGKYGVDPVTGYNLCRHGHVRSPDNVLSNGTCKQCQQERDKPGSKKAAALMRCES